MREKSRFSLEIKIYEISPPWSFNGTRSSFSERGIVDPNVMLYERSEKSWRQIRRSTLKGNFYKKKIKKWWLRHRIHFLYMRIQEHCDFISIQMLVFSRRSSSKNIFYFEFIYLFIY